MAELSPTDEIVIGLVGKPHGVRGGFHLEDSIDAPALVPGFKVRLDGDQFTVASRGGTDQRPLLVLSEIDDRDVIAARRGQTVTAPRATLTPLGEKEWYAQDLVGLEVKAERGGDVLGEVVELLNAPSVDLLRVVGDAGERLIPMVGDAIVEIAVGIGELIVDAEFLDLG